MAQSHLDLLTFEQFRSVIAKELMVPKDKVVPQASFVEDLLVDSIRMVEMMLKLEEMGMEIPLEAAWSIETVKDAYELYVQQAQDRATTAGPVAVTAGAD